jgi:hypothetical protein
MPLQLWPDPRDGLDPTDALSGLDPRDAPWKWRRIMTVPPIIPQTLSRVGSVGIFATRKPDGDKVKVSADRDPQTGEWFNPHLSTSQEWP